MTLNQAAKAKNANYSKSDFIVIGTGIAGLYAALNLSKIGSVTVLTKRHTEDSNTQYAQGGIAVSLDKDDSWELHMKDTIEAGAGLCNSRAVEILVKEGPEQVRNLMKLGTEFDRVGGKLDFTKEGAHSKRRILHAGGDATGKRIRESLTNLIDKHGNIEIKEENFVVDLILKNGSNDRIVGVLVWDNRAKEYEIHQASAVVLASGGCGQVYENTTNPDVATCDGVAIAYRAGAEITDMEFVQFHPTTLYNPGGLSFLISESVRGEGAILRNSSGKRFMPSYHKLAELAPRDVVARAILNEIAHGDKPYVWIDVTHFDPDYIVHRFPTIFTTLKDRGFDMRKEWIPVVPAAHYMMGGVKTDTFGRTNLENLYACGEVACTGVHGANRLASNSLLEGLVFAHRIYQAIKAKKVRRNYKIDDLVTPSIKPYGVSSLNLESIREKLRKKMMNQAGIKRNEKGLKDLLDWSQKKLELFSDTEYVDENLWELKNMLTIGNLCAKSAILRKESRGAHFRIDHPHPNKEWVHTHIVLTKNKDEEYVLEQ